MINFDFYFGNFVVCKLGVVLKFFREICRSFYKLRPKTAADFSCFPPFSFWPFRLDTPSAFPLNPNFSLSSPVYHSFLFSSHFSAFPLSPLPNRRRSNFCFCLGFRLSFDFVAIFVRISSFLFANYSCHFLKTDCF